MKANLNYLELAREVAFGRDGQCLSDQYKNARTPLTWYCCKCDKKWSNNLDNVKNKLQWCPYCAAKKKNFKRKLGIKFCKGLAIENGGVCLSNKYVNNSAKLDWKCKFGHIWSSSVATVKRNHWCPICGSDKKKKTMIDKYGVEHNSQHPVLREKILKSISKTSILKHWKSNEDIICTASYEKKVVEFFNKNKIEFEWQIPFNMPDGRIYIVDVFLPNRNIYIEIKGYFWKDAREKWEWFKKEYPSAELWDKKKLIKEGIL